MIRSLVDFSLENPFIILALALVLLVGGAISFHQLPVEAYPDVAKKLTHVPAESYIEKWFELHSDKLPTDGGQIKINLDEVKIL